MPSHIQYGFCSRVNDASTQIQFIGGGMGRGREIHDGLAKPKDCIHDGVAVVCKNCLYGEVLFRRNLYVMILIISRLLTFLKF